MVPQSHRICCKYWNTLWMLDHAGGYYGTDFKDFKGATQGDPLPPTILNMVVDAVVCHLILLVPGVAGVQDRWGREVRYCAEFFYVDDSLVALTDPVWMQGEFDTLTGLFDRVGLQKNVRKTVGIICHPLCAAGTQLEAVYERRMTGEGIIYRSRQRVRVQCPYYGENLKLGLLAVH